MKITSLNRKRNDWGINTKEMKFRKCREMPLDTPFRLRGVFITPDNGYGRGSVAILDDTLVNLPTRYLDTVELILSDEEMIDEIKSGKVAIRITKFTSTKYKKIGYNVNFEEI